MRGPSEASFPHQRDASQDPHVFGTYAELGALQTWPRLPCEAALLTAFTGDLLRPAGSARRREGRIRTQDCLTPKPLDLPPAGPALELEVTFDIIPPCPPPPPCGTSVVKTQPLPG